MSRLIDLSHNITAQTPVYPGDPPVELQRLASVQRDGYAMWQLSACMHAGTHVDAPMHFLDDGRPIGAYALDSFCAPGVLLDVRGQARIDMRAAYEALALDGAAVLLWTGSERAYGTGAYYDAHPEVTCALARFLVQAGVKIVGMDMPSPDRAPFTAHRILLEGGVFLVENLKNLSLAEQAGAFEFFALPLKISAEASLVRAFLRTEM